MNPVRPLGEWALPMSKALRRSRGVARGVEDPPALLFTSDPGVVLQATRNNFYVSSQCKQPVGTPHPGWLNWRTLNASALIYPQRPLVTTKAEEGMRAADLPAGVNLLCLISYADGYNQESAQLPASCRGRYSRGRSPRPIEREQQLPSESTPLPASSRGLYLRRRIPRPIEHESLLPSDQVLLPST